MASLVTTNESDCRSAFSNRRAGDVCHDEQTMSFDLITVLETLRGPDAGICNAIVSRRAEKKSPIFVMLSL